MTRFTPAIFKSIPLLLLLVSFCAVNVLASPTLHQDVINISDNDNPISVESANTSTDGKPAEGTDYTEENANLQQVSGSPELSGNVMGILFSPGDVCSGNNNSSSIPSNVSQYQRIALIKQGGCSLYDQINNVQKQQGVVGAIIYGEGSPSSDPKDIKIPILRIKSESGNELMVKLVNEDNAPPTPEGKRSLIRVVFLPSSNSLGGWQIAIIVIGSLLAASFLVSVLIHCRLYQLRRRERSLMMAQHEANVNAKLQGFTLEKSVVRTFPTRIYGKDKDSATLEGPDSSKLANSSSDHCSICLEEYYDREVLRELPCSHLYHMECVDKWLTTKSSNCPLCKQDATPPAIAEKREKKYIQSVQVQNRLDDIYNTSNTPREGSGESSSTFSRVLDMFGYGGSSSREAQSSHVRPTGGNLFGIQELPPVAVRDNINRVV